MLSGAFGGFHRCELKLAEYLQLAPRILEHFARQKLWLVPSVGRQRLFGIRPTDSVLALPVR